MTDARTTTDPYLAPRTRRSGGSAPVLVLGGGFIGAAVAAVLGERGAPVRLLTRSPLDEDRAEALAGVEVRLGDVTDPVVLADALDGAHHVVWAVGSATPAECELDPAAELSRVTAPLVATLEQLGRGPACPLTFVSSGGAVYGDPVHLPVAEDAPLRPVTAYGIAKGACEHFVRLHRRAHGVRAHVVRVANAYGPGQQAIRQQGLVAHLLRCAETGVAPTLFGSPDTVRDFVHIDDVADVIATVALDDTAPEVLNVGSGVGHRIGDVIELVEDVTGGELTAVPGPARSCDVTANVLDITRLRAYLDVDPLDLRTGIERTWKVWLDGGASGPGGSGPGRCRP